MINNISKHIRLAFAALTTSCLALGGCMSDNPSGPDANSNPAGIISLTLRSSKISSRAVEDDVDALNENLIKSAYFCFYPADNPSDKPLLVEYIKDIDKKTTATVDIPLDRDIKDTLFPENENTDYCYVYVIANPSDGMTAPTTDMTFDEIKRIAISANFASSNVQPSFTMDAAEPAMVTIKERGQTSEHAEGTILLQRCASKITLAVNVEETLEITDDDGNVVERWGAQLDNMSVLITDGVRRSQIASMQYVAGANEDIDDYYSTLRNASDGSARERRLIHSDLASDQSYPYVLDSPFYTFPTKWEASSAESRQLFMTLMVPWGKIEEGQENPSSFRTCYYTVPVIRGSEIGRNVSYRVNLHVQMLGSFTPDTPFELTPLSYYAVNWGEVSTEVELADSRYLVVDQTAFTLNNEASIEIPVYTSHETVVTGAKMTYYLYNATNQGFETPVTITWEENKLSSDNNDHSITENPDSVYYYNFHNAEAADNSNYLTFDHKMLIWNPRTEDGGAVTFPKNSTTAATDAINSIAYYVPTNTAAYSRYVTTITIAHEDRPEYTQTFTITQYPQVYITSTQNAYTANTNMSARAGNLWVNGYQAENFGNEGTWYMTYGLATRTGGTNVNPNQYVINVTQLNEGEDYVIGDPRVSEYTNLRGWKNNFGNNNQNAPNNNWAQANDMTGTQRRLKYYYPTDESISKARWIAPSFRIASSYGVCRINNSYAEDKARCASYQELSRPAGRWRMPTVAEMEYIMKLSQQGKIPALFSGAEYMTAQGLTSTTFTNGKLTTPTTGTAGEGSVRCVYDEWYWGNDTITKGTNGYYPFTWGDRERTAVDPKP